MKKKFIYITLLCLPVFATFSSCNKNDDSAADDNPTAGTVNEYSPNANNLISSQEVFGNEDQRTSCYEMKTSTDGNFYFFGIYNSVNAVGKITKDGDMIWVVETDYLSTGMLTVDDNLLVCGNENLDHAYLQMFDGSNGSLLSSLTLNDYANIRVDGMNEKYIVGRCRPGYVNNIMPLMAEYSIDGTGTIALESINPYDNQEFRFFYDVKEDYILGGTCNGTFDNFEKNAIMLYRFDTASFDLLWDLQIDPIPSTMRMEGRDIIISDNIVYIIGFTEVEEELNPGDDGYWKDGLVARVSAYSSHGELNYMETYKASIYSDYYYSAYFDGTYLYACGRHSYHYNITTSKKFAYGLISKIEPASGELIEHKTFGNKTYASGFNDVVFDMGSFYCAGYINDLLYSQEITPFQGWLVKIENF